MGLIESATTITLRARLTKLGRQKLLTNSNTVFSHFILGDSDANYNTDELLPSGTVPTTSGNLAFISGDTNDNIESGVGINSKIFKTSNITKKLVVQPTSSTINLTPRSVGETTVSGSNLTYVAIDKTNYSAYTTNYFKSLSLPILLNDSNKFLIDNTQNNGWSDTAFSGLGVSNILLGLIGNSQYGEIIDGKSIRMTLPVYTGYTTGGDATGYTTYTLYSTFPNTSSVVNDLNDFQYKDISSYPQLLFGNQINVSYLVSDQIQRPNNDALKSWSTGYDTFKPFTLGEKEKINVQAVAANAMNSDRIAGVAYLDKGIFAITDQTIVNNIATNFSGDSTTDILNDSLGLYYYTAGTYNSVIDSIQNDLVQDIVCIAENGEFVTTQNETWSLGQNIRISEIGITDSSGNILALSKPDRHIERCQNEMIVFNVQIVI